MNSVHQNILSKGANREAIGVVAKLVAIIVATFVFAAFSSPPAQPQSTAPSAQSAGPSLQTPNHPR